SAGAAERPLRAGPRRSRRTPWEQEDGQELQPHPPRASAGHRSRVLRRPAPAPQGWAGVARRGARPLQLVGAGVVGDPSGVSSRAPVTRPTPEDYGPATTASSAP